jgi:hypothetical protein
MTHPRAFIIASGVLLSQFTILSIPLVCGAKAFDRDADVLR